MITPAQCRAARGLLKWRQQDLADKAKVGVATVRNFENDHVSTNEGTLVLIRQTLEAAGVAFIDENGGGPGVRLRK